MAKKTLLILITVCGFTMGCFLAEALKSDETRVVVAPVVERSVNIDTSTELEFEPFNEQKIKQAVEDHLLRTDATYGISIFDPNNNQLLAEHNPSQTFTSASLYKLYYAFLAWQDVDEGTFNLADNLYQDKSLERCLDIMIRESDSPCGEALLALYEYQEAQTRLEELGLSDTNAAGFRTSANDMRILLNRVILNQGISENSANSMRRSMENQIYDKGLKTGFSELTFQDKVGFSAEGDWHDVGIVMLPDGRELIVSVLSLGAGSSGLAELSKVLQQAL